MAREPAVSEEEFWQAFAIGLVEAELAYEEGYNVVATGEMGIGNSTSAACLTMLLTDAELTTAVGRGAGASDAIMQRKRTIVADAVATATARIHPEPIVALASVAGLEIAAMSGFFTAADELKLTVVLDGYIATAAALLAHRLRPGCGASMIAAHRSVEAGHTAALERLQLTPYLDGWNMRLGEGTGALLMMLLLDAAAAMVSEMATFASAGMA